MQATAVVLGAGGFLGRYICKECRRQGVRVVGVGRTFPHEQHDFAQFYPLDLREADLESLLRDESPAWVINAAGSSSVGQSFAQPYEDWCQTVQVQARILEAIRRESPNSFYIFLSSAAVYGEPEYLPIREDSPCRPISPYGMHKWQAELLQDEYSRFHGLRGAVLRIFSAYGEGLQKQVVYELSQKILYAKDCLEVYGTGEETRDFIHASDVARVVCCVAEREAVGVYNVASGRQTSIGELAKVLVNRLRPGLPIRFTGEGKAGDPLKWEADVSRLRQLGFVVEKISEDMSIWDSEIIHKGDL